jgi:hypothetical protein
MTDSSCFHTSIYDTDIYTYVYLHRNKHIVIELSKLAWCTNHCGSSIACKVPSVPWKLCIMSTLFLGLMCTIVRRTLKKLYSSCRIDLHWQISVVYERTSYMGFELGAPVAVIGHTACRSDESWSHISVACMSVVKWANPCICLSRQHIRASFAVLLIVNTKMLVPYV